ncbi:hypothetical protein [Marinomonas rhodophyticola]|uniref:Uncharacterized protein n=1 Tax=Marinomonas rhodophyticola TaxID=2992803 RepID=A0ABT3KDA0_9GAMM|nr:hypothetical protein [Marinomonas sp. KJ51-3]MCW4628513.1 hypothetical protein [Marinomonas sp. KJ51-3]
MSDLTIKRRVMIPVRAGDVMAEFISFNGDDSGKEHIGIFLKESKRKPTTVCH